jgi:formylglycine-generating enzyme required for sulfatase activity
MIGNLGEWTSDWYGQGGDGDIGNQPADYFGDGYSNVDAAALQGSYATHFPAAGIRDGSGHLGAGAGAFMVSLTDAPSQSGRNIGFRCVIH